MQVPEFFFGILNFVTKHGLGRSVGAIDLMSDEMMRGVGRARPRESQGGLWSTAHCAGPHVACVFWARITLGWSQDHWAVTPCCDIWALFQGWIFRS